ncbi:MAG: hypothetical protein NC184_05385 [Roseburia sp.]|nr:hypothetical protein [Roseburia sp.]
MKKFMIFVSDDSDVTEQESIIKECRDDVLVSYDGLTYPLDVMTISRIKFELDLARNDDQVYYLNNTIVVENLKRNTVIHEIVKLVESNAIKAFSTIDLQQFYQNSFPELQCINNWKRIY